MPHVICYPCIDEKSCDSVCESVCPSSAIHGDKEEDGQLFINPDECIDCEACTFDCPAEAIHIEEDVPPEWESYIDKNLDFFD